jgi:pantetheine-phosphate adenylyltransferase
VAQVQPLPLADQRVLAFDGLIMDFCAAGWRLVRGARHPGLTDFDYHEAQMAAMNRKLRPALRPCCCCRRPVQCISNTLVREISKLGGDEPPWSARHRQCLRHTTPRR